MMPHDTRLASTVSTWVSASFVLAMAALAAGVASLAYIAGDVIQTATILQGAYR